MQDQPNGADGATLHQSQDIITVTVAHEHAPSVADALRSIIATRCNNLDVEFSNRKSRDVSREAIVEEATTLTLTVGALDAIEWGEASADVKLSLPREMVLEMAEGMSELGREYEEPDNLAAGHALGAQIYGAVPMDADEREMRATLRRLEKAAGAMSPGHFWARSFDRTASLLQIELASLKP